MITLKSFKAHFIDHINHICMKNTYILKSMLNSTPKKRHHPIPFKMLFKKANIHKKALFIYFIFFLNQTERKPSNKIAKI